MLAIRLPAEIEARLDALAKATKNITWKIEFDPAASKELKKLDKQTAKRNIRHHSEVYRS